MPQLGGVSPITSYIPKMYGGDTNSGIFGNFGDQVNSLLEANGIERDDIINSLISYRGNKALADFDREFQSNEAKISRDWQAEQNQLARDWQTSANKIAMDFSHNEAVANRQWQTELANTAHQREVADLRAAGLNPILAASMSGADTPSGAVASGVSTSPSFGGSASTARGSSSHVMSQLGDLVDIVSSVFNSARSISRIAKGLF